MQIKKALAQKLLLFFVGLLFVLLGTYSQLNRINEPKKQILADPQESRDRDLVPRLKASLLQQSRNLQRCWLQSAQNPEEQVWQIYIQVEPSGKASQFQVLNAGNLNPETTKCLTELGQRLRFPTFEGESFSFTIPIRMAKEPLTE